MLTKCSKKGPYRDSYNHTYEGLSMHYPHILLALLTLFLLTPAAHATPIILNISGSVSGVNCGEMLHPPACLTPAVVYHFSCSP